jgi:hypothetical protein
MDSSHAQLTAPTRPPNLSFGLHGISDYGNYSPTTRDQKTTLNNIKTTVGNKMEFVATAAYEPYSQRRFHDMTAALGRRVADDTCPMAGIKREVSVLGLNSLHAAKKVKALGALEDLVV